MAPRRSGYREIIIYLKTIFKQVRDHTRSEPLRNRTSATGTLLLSGGPWTPHDLRRTTASHMRQLGIPADIVKRCLNRKETDPMVIVYQHHEAREEQQEAWRRLGEHLDRLMPSKTRIPHEHKA